MTRKLLERAQEEVRRASTDSEGEISERLTKLANRLHYQATEKQSTPALGALDRIQYSLQEIAEETDRETVATRLERAREHIVSFLGTLDDRGMKQH